MDELEELVEEGQVKKNHTIRNIILIALIFAIALGGYLGYNQFFAKTVIKSNSDYFQIKVPKKYNYVENTLATDAEMGVYDTKKHTYIFGYSYMSEDDFKGTIEELYQSYAEDTTFWDLADLTSDTINGFESYLFSYVYTDTSVETDYYCQEVYIDGAYGIYVLYIECLAEDQSRYESDFVAIAKTFKELE